MKSLMLLWKKLADESAGWCCTSAMLDKKYVEHRVKHEGLSFLAITLPTFGKDLQKGLDQGYVDRNLFQGFPWQAGLPRFLGGFLDLVFDRTSGRLLADPSIDAILAVRQLTLLYSKILEDCSDARIKDAMDEFVQCEQDVRTVDKHTSPAYLREITRMSTLLYSSIFSIVDREIHDGNVRPKHGPGVTAERKIGNEKYRQTTWPARLDKWFPIGDHLLPNHRYYDELERIDILEPGRELPSRVVTVPKTLKTPRIIAIEPIAMQYAQQGIRELLYDTIEKRVLPFSRKGREGINPISYMIGFSDQGPNQSMAEEGSKLQNLATLDLSEASDRVSNQHVRAMLANFPHLQGAVDACRTRKADVQGHGVIRLAKFAPMGSALCFPMEAMVFLIMVFLGLESAHNRRFTKRDVQSFIGEVRIYGDDIIVPVDHVHTVVRSLESFGIKVNAGKSYWNGKFRESCGKEYYAGSDVSVVRCRRKFPTQRQDVEEISSIVSFRNQLYQAGYWQTCRWLDDYIRGVIKYFPVVLPTSSAIGRHSFLGYETQIVGGRYQAPLVKALVRSDISPNNSLDDYFALLKYFLKRGDLPVADGKHLERSGRPWSANIKTRRVSPF